MALHCLMYAYQHSLRHRRRAALMYWQNLNWKKRKREVEKIGWPYIVSLILFFSTFQRRDTQIRVAPILSLHTHSFHRKAGIPS